VTRALVVVAFLGCGGTQPPHVARRDLTAAPRALQGARGASDRGRCDRPGAISQETDTNRDGVKDVRRTYAKIGDADASRMVLVCREVDLNHDGRKDVIRYYTDDGRPLREEADRDFDGRFDEVAFFENAKIARREQDTNGDGRVDQWVYIDHDKVARAERDTNGDGRKDYWEYYLDGHVQRIGIDTDGDGVVDHWDRNAALERPEEQDQGPGASDEGPETDTAADAGPAS
jgi:hypothetical protein